MEKLDFNSGWTVCHVGEEAKACPVQLPHDAMIFESRTADSAGGINTGWFEGFDYIYEKTFFAPANWAEKIIVIEFEGVYHNAEVYLNEEKISFRPYGYTNFYVELSNKLILNGENTLRVVAQNADQPNSRWYSGAGIYRPVWLYLMPKEHIVLNGIKVKTLSYKEPEILIQVKTTGNGPVQVEILDDETVLTVAKLDSQEGKISLPGIQLWSPDNPKLYRCRAIFGQDMQETTFGVRLVECDAQQGLRINGRRIILRGACIHHDNGLLGAMMHPFAEERKIRLLKENGYNSVRSAHNPCSKAMLDACDRLGVLVMDEYADMWYIHKTQYDYASYLPEWWKQDLSDLVDKDYNHPSVIMYSIGNEVSETAQARGIRLTKDMRDFLHTLDERPVTCGVNIFFNFLSSMGFGVYSDSKARKEAKKAENQKGKKKTKAVGSEFFNNLAGLMGSGFMKFGATLHGSDVKTRDAFANMDVAGYNYGINRYKKDLKKYPDRVIVGSETFCSDAYRFWEIAKYNSALIGDFVWAGMDYLGEVGIGAWDYPHYTPRFDHGVGWVSAGSGRLDLTGKPIGEAAYTQVAFELSPIRIGVVPADHAYDKHTPSAWKMTNTFESWSWNGCEGKKTKVEVYARGAEIALFLNGEKLGSKKPQRDCRVIFEVEYHPGELLAISYDNSGKELCRTSLRSADDDTQLILLPEKKAVSLNELCYVRLQYTDHNGEVKPLERGNIKVTVTGGTLLGLGSACPYNERGFLTCITDTYYGEALAIIQPKSSESIVVHADDGQHSAEITVSII